MADPLIIVNMTSEEREALRELPFTVNFLKRQTHLVAEDLKPPTPTKEQWLSVDEVRILCRCQIGRVRRAIEYGALPATEESSHKGGKMAKFILRQDAMIWMRNGRPEQP